MDSLKGLAKKGWHPEKDGKGLTATIKKAVGRDKDDIKYTTYSTPYERKDPSSFPPPPKTKTYEPGEGPVPPAKPATSSYRVETPALEPDMRRFDGPFKSDGTGKDVSSFPKPPPRAGTQSQESGSTTGPAPSLPPRLPPRNSQPDVSPGVSEGYINQGAIDRLGKAGISVPGFNIGSLSQPSSNSASSRDVPTTGTTWAEKKAALKTASNIRTNPSSVSFQDVKSAAATTRNFRDRHGEQVAAGFRTASQLNQRYGIVNRISDVPGQSASDIPPQLPKKAPPPPPPKKNHLQGSSVKPPPVPFDGKPQG